MFKKILLAAVPLILSGASAFAGDDVLSDVANLKADSIKDASIAIEAGVGALDVDALAANAGQEKMTDAIEARYKNKGGSSGYGYNSYYYNYYQPTYYYYPTYFTYQPVFYPTYYPVYTYYWGCH